MGRKEPSLAKVLLSITTSLLSRKLMNSPSHSDLNLEQMTESYKSVWMEHRASDMSKQSFVKQWRFPALPMSIFTNASVPWEPLPTPRRRGPSEDPWNNPSWTRIPGRVWNCLNIARMAPRPCITTCKHTLIIDHPVSWHLTVELQQDHLIFMFPIMYKY